MRDIAIWRHELIDDLRTIANRSELERLWSGADPHAISSYQEEVDNVFSFHDIDGFLSLDPAQSGLTPPFAGSISDRSRSPDPAQSGLTPPQMLALRRFRDEFSNYVEWVNGDYKGRSNFRVVLADPQWAHIMSLAQEFVALIDKETGSG